jgi:hypothetical protein
VRVIDRPSLAVPAWSSMLDGHVADRARAAQPRANWTAHGYRSTTALAQYSQTPTTSSSRKSDSPHTEHG